MADLIPYISNTNTIKLLLRDQIAETAPNSATVTYTLKDTAGSTIDSGSLTYDSYQVKRNKTFAQYLGTIAHTVSLSENTLYYLNITVSHDSKQGLWENIRVKPKKREMRI